MALATWLTTAGLALAQSDDFNAGNDAGWTHLDLSAAGLPSQIASYAFPDDGAGGKAYRIKALPPPADLGGAAGPARAFSYRSTVYSRFSVTVDMVNWDQTINQAFGILVRAAPISLGDTDGYVMNYNVADGNLQINQVTQENPTTIAEVPVALDPVANRYRFVFTGYEDNFVGWVYVLPDLANPVASVVATDDSYASGKAGLFVFDRNDPPTYTYADATFDNYDASVPPVGSLRAAVVQLSPLPNERAKDPQPTVKVAILDRETTVDAGSVQLTVDGAVIPGSSLVVSNEVVLPNNPGSFPGVTISYQFPNALALESRHTNRVTFKDNTGAMQTNEWIFTAGYPLLRGVNAAPPGSGLNPGFALRLVQAPADANLNNSLAVAESQLAVPSPINAAFSTNTTAAMIDFTRSPLPATSAHALAYAANFPGIDPAVQTEPDYLAMEALAFLELSAGSYRFGILSDDGFKLASGSSLTDTNALVLASRTGGTFDGTVDFAVEAAGLYPFRFVWYQTRGDAYVQLYSVSLNNGALTLINDPSVPGAIKAYQSVVAAPVLDLVSASVVIGPYSIDTTATYDPAAKTYTVPLPAANRFYQVRSSAAIEPRPGVQVRIEGQSLSITVK